MDDKELWILAFITKLARGEIIEDAATAADKAVDKYKERWDYEESET